MNDRSLAMIVLVLLGLLLFVGGLFAGAGIADRQHQLRQRTAEQFNCGRKTAL